MALNLQYEVEPPRYAHDPHIIGRLTSEAQREHGSFYRSHPKKNVNVGLHMDVRNRMALQIMHSYKSKAVQSWDLDAEIPSVVTENTQFVQNLVPVNSYF